MPVLDHCAACGGGERALGFSAARGGLVCGDCLDERVPITPEAIEALREALERPLAELARGARRRPSRGAARRPRPLRATTRAARLRALRFARAAG